jgi:hypothetical protein
VKALSGFRAAVRVGDFPDESEVAGIAEVELEAFRRSLEAL